MKQTKRPWGIKVFIATLVLTCFAYFPAPVFADGLDDLDVTMEVMDDMAGIDDAVLEMRGPEGDDFVGGDGDDPGDDSGDDFDDKASDHEEGGEGDSGEDDFGEEQREFEEHEDDFEDDDDFDEEDLDEEDDFEEEEGEDVDI